eukprot:scaffold143278_cov66-Phaeocystis_antarctica.AAC.1
MEIEVRDPASRSRVACEPAAGDGAIRLPWRRQDDAAQPHAEQPRRSPHRGGGQRHGVGERRRGASAARRDAAAGGEDDRALQRLHLPHAMPIRTPRGLRSPHPEWRGGATGRPVGCVIASAPRYMQPRLHAARGPAHVTLVARVREPLRPRAHVETLIAPPHSPSRVLRAVRRATAKSRRPPAHPPARARARAGAHRVVGHLRTSARRRDLHVPRPEDGRGPERRGAPAQLGDRCRRSVGLRAARHDRHA